ncbi:hypothetical protein SO694_00099095 [Aureococcus anophagefferens]|uniref:Uncharacterized protein n=1 Tax=Aureococcus anophagefferens TaxID=44056 RepID=A0ABR1FSN5_AURAN
MDEVLLCLDRGDASSFTLKLATKGKAVTAKKLLATFCKQHAKKCPADAPLDPAACSLDPEIRDTETVTGGTFFVRCAAVAAAPVPPAARADADVAAARRRRPGRPRKRSARSRRARRRGVVRDGQARAHPRVGARRRAAPGAATGADARRARARPAAAATPTKKLSSRELVASTVAHFDAHADEIDRLLTEVRRMAQLDDAIDAFDLRGAVGDHGAVYAGLRRVLEPATGLLVLADSDFSERLEPTLVEGAHHERRPFSDYDANLKAAGFELVERTTYLVGDDAFFAGVWRCAAPPKSRAAVAAARKPGARAPAADIPGLP